MSPYAWVMNRLMSQVWYVFSVSYHLWLIPMKHSPSALLGVYNERVLTWWRHQMETLSALLVICVGNSPVTGKFAPQRPVARSFDVSLICAWINGWVNNREVLWFETPSCALWRHCNGRIYRLIRWTTSTKYGAEPLVQREDYLRDGK